MSLSGWLLALGAASLVILIGVLDTIKRIQRQRTLTKMTPANREIQLREDKVFNRAFARWWFGR